MNVGVVGKKYGLQLPKKAEEKGEKKKLVSKPPPSVFAVDEDDDVEADIARQASKKKSARELELMHAKALEQDPSIFDYDGVYDEIKGAREKVKEEKQAAKQPKYIAKLLEKAKEREMERDIVYERQLIKERAKEDHLFGDKERFVTSSYKRKLAEQAKWVAEEKLREQREAADEVTKKGDMSDFYRNLLSKNVAFGAKPPLPSSEAGKKLAAPGAAATMSEPPESTTAPAKRTEPDSVQSGAENRKDIGSGPSVGAPPPSTDREGEAGPSGRRTEEEQGKPWAVSMSAGGAEEPRAADVSKLARIGVDARGESRPKLASDDHGASAGQVKSDGKSDAAVGGKGAVDAVAAARERYLARKKMRT